MNEEPTETEILLQIMLRESIAEAVEIALPGLMKHFELNRNETLAHILTAGLVIVRRQVAVTKRESQVMATIGKLKSGEHVSSDELELVSIAASNGHLAAKIIVDDFKRFGRSIAKD
jgi:hypothetical protein